jgi:hypothetical protein
MAVYAFTAPVSVVLEDDGEFVMAVYFLGVAHPPGYPLYVLLAHPFTWLPVGSIAFRVHLASAFFGAAACGVIWWIVRALIPRKSVAYTAALAFGVSRVFWSQAVIAEVYTLNVLLFSLMLATCLAYLHWRRFEALVLLAFLFGLGLSNHWPLIVLAAPCLLLALWPAWRTIVGHLPRALAYGLPLFLVGLAPYAWMVLRSQAAPELSFAGSIHSWEELRYYFSRGQYADASPSAGWWDRAQFGAFWVRQMIEQFTPLGAVFVAAGLVFQWRAWKPSLSLGLLAGFLCTLVALVLLRNVDYQFDSQAITKVFPLIPWSIMALWLALGLQRVTSRFASAPGWKGGAAGVGVGGLVVATAFLANRSYNDRRDYDFAHDYGMTFLSSFEPDAIVFTHGDFETFVLQYLHFVEGVRPDLRILHDRGVSMALDGRLLPERVRTVRLLDESQQSDRIHDLVDSHYGPVYFLQGAPHSLSDFDYGFYKKIDRSQDDQATTTLMVDEELLELFRRALTPRPHEDEGTTNTRALLIGQMVRVLAPLVYLHPDPNHGDRYRADLELGMGSFAGLLAAGRVLEGQEGATPERLLAWLTEGEALVDSTVGKAQRAELFLLKGRVLKKLGRLHQAIDAFERSAAVYAHPDNEAAVELSETRRALR